MPLVALADAETLVRGFLLTLFPAPGHRIVTELPANLADVTPLIQVARFGGSSPLITMDAANLDVDYFDIDRNGSSGRENARTGLGLVRSALLYHLPGYAANGGAVQSVSEISGPRWAPYDNTTSNLRRFTAAYRITIHSIPS